MFASNGGIYCIEDGYGRLYYGSTNNFRDRFTNHRSTLNRGKHPNKKLQHAWSKYGESFFTFYPVEIVLNPTKDNLIPREQFWLDFVFTTESWHYNLRRKAESNSGYKHSKESRAKMSEAQKGNKKGLGNTSRRGKKFTPEQSARLSEARKGNTNRRGKPSSVDTLIRVALTLSGGRVYTFISPDDTVYSDVYNVAAFAKDHGLDKSGLQKVASGKWERYRGWKLLSVRYIEEYKKAA